MALDRLGSAGGIDGIPNLPLPGIPTAAQEALQEDWDVYLLATAAISKGIQAVRAAYSLNRGTKAAGEVLGEVETVAAKSAGRLPGPTVDPRTGQQVGRFIGDTKGNAMIEPVGGSTVKAGPTLKGGVRQDTHTTYPNGSTYQRLNPSGHANNPTPHAHGYAQGTGPGMRNQGSSLDIHGNQVTSNSLDAHWPAY